MAEEAASKVDAPAASGPAPGASVTPARRRGPVRQIPAARPPIDPVEQNKVVQIVRWMEQEATRARTKRIKPWLLVSVLAGILLPTLLAGIYYFVIAADQYVSEARFAVRSNEAQGADVLGMLSGMPRATVVSDSYIVADYVRSAEMVAELERRIRFRDVYARPEADFLTRLDPTASREELVRYWGKRIDVGYDSTKNTVAVNVRAFSPEDAQNIVREIVDVTRNLINELSVQSRRDASSSRRRRWPGPSFGCVGRGRIF
jgi:capsular polysaccharide transport system permease protein